jgi:hypothetical protein
MTKDEILEDLLSKNIIIEIAGDYLITEKYKELLAKPLELEPQVVEKQPLNYDSILNAKTNGSDWPVEILETAGRVRLTALMDLCDIPSTAPKGYRLRGLNREAINILGNIIDTKTIDASTMIDAITLYYKYMECPKAFKTLAVDGDILDIYQEHIAGTFRASLNISPSENSNEWR